MPRLFYERLKKVLEALRGQNSYFYKTEALRSTAAQSHPLGAGHPALIPRVVCFDRMHEKSLMTVSFRICQTNPPSSTQKPTKLLF
jgi:hypothetical protein